MARSRFVGSGRTKEGGFLATHKQDFEAHRTGGDWRHTADQVDMNPTLATFTGTQVQAVLEQIEAYVTSGAGTYLTIGDGYATGDINIGDPGISSLEDALNSAFLNARLQNGGTIVIKAGTYSVTTTVTVPPGINIVGDMTGTYINCLTTTNSPIFRIQRTLKYFELQQFPDVAENVESLDRNVVANLIFVDNLNGSAPKLASNSMILCERGSHVTFAKCSFMGRGSNASYSITNRAIGYIGSTPNRRTVLHVTDCFFDGLKSAIEFEGEEGDNDYLIVENCRARTFGDSASSTQEDNSFISANLCNMNIVNNNFVGLGPSTETEYGAEYFLVIKNQVASGAPRVVLMGNTGEIDGETTRRDNLVFDDRTVKATYNAMIVNNNWGYPNLQISNSWTLTCGNGLTTFGDFNGTNAVVNAAAFLKSLVDDGLRSEVEGEIFVKHGSYTVSADLFSGYTLNGLKIRGETSTGSIINFSAQQSWSMDSSADHAVMSFEDVRLNGTSSIVRFRVSDNNFVTLNRSHFHLDRCHVENIGFQPYNIERTQARDTRFDINVSGSWFPMQVLSPINDSSIDITGCSFYNNIGTWVIEIGHASVAADIQRVNISNNTFELSGRASSVGPFQGGPVLFDDPSSTTYGNHKVRNFTFSNNHVATSGEGGQSLLWLRTGEDGTDLDNQWQVQQMIVEGNTFEADYTADQASVTPVVITGAKLFPVNEEKNGIERLIFRDNNIRCVRGGSPGYGGMPIDYSDTFLSGTEPGLVCLVARELTVDGLRATGMVLEDNRSDMAFNGVTSANISRIQLEYNSAGSDYYVSGSGDYPQFRIGVYNPQGWASIASCHVRVENCDFRMTLPQFIDDSNLSLGFLGLPNIPGVADGSGHTAKYLIKGNHFFNVSAGATSPLSYNNYIYIRNFGNRDYDISHNHFHGTSVDSYAIFAQFVTEHPQVAITDNVFDSTSVLLRWQYNTVTDSAWQKYMQFCRNRMIKGSLNNSYQTADTQLKIVQTDTPEFFNSIVVTDNVFTKEVTNGTYYSVQWGDPAQDQPRGVFMGNATSYATSGGGSGPGLVRVFTLTNLAIRGLEDVSSASLNAQNYPPPGGAVYMAFNSGYLQ